MKEEESDRHGKFYLNRSFNFPDGKRKQDLALSYHFAYRHGDVGTSLVVSSKQVGLTAGS
jgi:hypothetical protein